MQEEPLIIQGPVVKYQRMNQQDFLLEKTGIQKKKEGRFNPGGQVFMRQRRTVSVLAPRSNVHIHSVTLGESLELIKKLNCHQRTTRIIAEQKTNKISRKRTAWDPQEERREI